MYFLALLCITTLIIICILIYYLQSKIDVHVPKIIWTYWHDEKEMPVLAKRCIDTWYKMNPDYEIVVLTPERLKELTNIDILSLKIDMKARHADFARLFVLSKYGGIWMDATIICTESLNWVQKYHSNIDLLAFLAPQTTNSIYPIPENWFLAAPPNSKFINDWIEEGLYMLSFPSEQAYVDHIVKNTHIDTQGLSDALPYLVMHLCATAIMQKNRNKYKIHLMSGVDGPFKYLHKFNWESLDGLHSLCTDESNHYPIIKMRGTERKIIEETGFYCPENNGSIVHRVFSELQNA